MQIAICKKRILKKILILGASGFIGNSIQKELSKYYNTFGTYCTNKLFKIKNNFQYYDITSSDINNIIIRVKPNLIISCLKGPFSFQIKTHESLIKYVKKNNCRIMFISSSNVFDAFEHFPSYEYDKTLSKSRYGKFKSTIENLILKLNPAKYVIIRLPMVFGIKSHRNKEIKLLIKENKPIDVYPNTIVNINSDIILSQQINYIINKNLSGIFHLGTKDLISHFDLIKKIVGNINIGVKFKHIYTTNNLRYLAVLPKKNCLPSHLYPSCESIINMFSLNFNIYK